MTSSLMRSALLAEEPACFAGYDVLLFTKRAECSANIPSRLVIRVVLTPDVPFQALITCGLRELICNS